MVRRLTKKRKVQPKCLQGERVEEGVHLRNNVPPGAVKAQEPEQEPEASDTTNMGRAGGRG